MRELLHSEVARVEFAIVDGEPDATPTAGCYAGTTLLGSATVASLGGERNYSATYTLPSSGITPYTVISFRVDAAVDAVDLPTVMLVAGELVAARRNATMPLDAAGTRTAVGLASANLDTQLADLPTVAEFEARSLPSADYFVVGDYTAPLDAAGIRSAVGLAAANLDTQIADIPTVAEFNARSLPNADYFVVGDYTAPDNVGISSLNTKIIGTLASGTHQPQGGDAWARLGAPARASIAADIAAIEGGGGGGEIINVVTIPSIVAELEIEDSGPRIRYQGTLWTIAIEGLVAIPDKCYCTLKRNDEPDARAVFQILKTNPSDAASDGLKVLAGQVATTRSDGSIVYSSYSIDEETRYRAAMSLQATAAASIKPGTYRLDFKDVATDTVLAEATIICKSPVTMATA